MIFKMIEHSKFYTYLCLFYPDIYWWNVENSMKISQQLLHANKTQKITIP